MIVIDLHYRSTLSSLATGQRIQFRIVFLISAGVRPAAHDHRPARRVDDNLIKILLAS